MMRILKALSVAKGSRGGSIDALKFWSLNFRNLHAQSDYFRALDFKDEVMVEGKAHARAAVLNRPEKLNALNISTVGRLKRLYEAWEDNPDVGFVVMKGSGRAFSAGGDVVALHQFLNQGKMEDCKEFLRTLYNFIYLQGTYLKPHVAILDGITTGGGGGISLLGTFRVATNKTVFSTPEAQIGYHPDAGASHYLSRLPGYLGEYMALTGNNLNGEEMVTCGLATHYSVEERLTWIDERFDKLITDKTSVIQSSLEQYSDIVYPDKGSVLRRIEAIDECFSKDTVEEIIDALGEEAASSNERWCTVSLRKLKEASPLSLKVSLRSIREGRFQSLDECLKREYRISLRMMSKEVSKDFCEGVRAQLIDKDYAPKWNPPSLSDVSKDMVDFHFAPFSELEPKLELPSGLREPDF